MMSFIHPYIEATFNEAIMSRLGVSLFSWVKKSRVAERLESLKQFSWEVVRNSFNVSKNLWLWTVFRPEVSYRLASPVSDVEL